MTDRLILLAALVIAFLPGAALLLALRIRTPLLFVGLIPTASIGVLLLIATACAPLGLPFSAVTAGVVVAALLTVGMWRHARGGARWLPPRPGAPAVVGALATAAGAAFAGRTWLRGFGGLDRAAQEHDMITHQVLVAYVARTGRAASWEIRPVDLLTGTPVTFYPQGGHLAPALLSGLGPGPVAALNAFTVIYLAAGWVVSAAVLTAVVARRLRPGTTTAWLAAGTAAVVASALYRPGLQLMHDGGIYSAAVALALAPGLLAALLLVPDERRARTAVVAGIASAGIVAVHPSAAVTVGLSLLAWWVGDTVTADGRSRVMRSLPALAGAGTIALLVAFPVLIGGGGGIASTSAFQPGRAGTRVVDALGSAVTLAYGGYFDQGRVVIQVWLTALYLAGLFVVVRAGRDLGVVVAWALWVAVTISVMVAPGAGPARLITGFFYTALPRIWSHVSLFVPTLAALGVVLSVVFVVARLRRLVPGLRGPWARPVASVAVLAVVVGLLTVPVRHAATLNTATVTSRYAVPEFSRIDDDDLAAIDFLRGRVPPDERVLNSPNDGSTFLYVLADIPVVNVSSLGTGAAPYTFELLRSFSRYPADPEVRATLRQLNVTWVYVDDRAPAIGASGAPDNWVDPAQPFTVAPGLTGLDRLGLPGLTLSFRSGSVSVYRLELGPETTG